MSSSEKGTKVPSANSLKDQSSNVYYGTFRARYPDSSGGVSPDTFLQANEQSLEDLVTIERKCGILQSTLSVLSDA